MGRSRASRMTWRLQTDDVAMYRRAQERKRHNIVRKFAAEARRCQVKVLLVRYGSGRDDPGSLGVSHEVLG